ncbi:MAG: nucleotidyltransferase family protein [Actinomycetota bacterium]|nr:nucleotidyltransferase family protein [Actinomycetota bacterium]MDQ6945458.1 nucleotidyltransferase family protein [Actinomycetota bacterium]
MVEKLGQWAGLSATELLARSLFMEMAAGEAFEWLERADVASIVLKGPAVATWLYQPNEVRPSVDVDLLVAPEDFDRAEHALEQLGYRHRLRGGAACEIASNARELLGDNGICIDLHHHLIGLADPVRSWDLLSRRTTSLRLASGAEVAVLDLSARTMHLALHAAQDGPQDLKALADLERGLAQVPIDTWRAAATLADQLGATAAFAAGLRLCPPGRAVAAELGLPDLPGVELTLRVRSAPHESLFFEHLSVAPGVAAKVKLVSRKLWPTNAYLKSGAPEAVGLRCGLAVARCRRLASLTRRAPPALRAWYQARRELGKVRRG